MFTYGAGGFTVYNRQLHNDVLFVCIISLVFLVQEVALPCQVAHPPWSFSVACLKALNQAMGFNADVDPNFAGGAFSDVAI